MGLFPEPIEFQWDKGNIEKPKTHGLTPEETEEVFFDKNKIIFKDWQHSTSIEQRVTLLGKTKSNKLLNIIYIIRRNKIRVITARPINKKEVHLYEKKA